MRAGVSVRLAQAATVIVVLAVWQAYGSRPSIAVSSPSDVFAQLRQWSTTGDRWEDLRSTITVAARGLLLGMIVGGLMAIVVSLNASVARFLAPIIGALNALPRIALAPAFILAFGIGTNSKTFFVATALFLVPFYNIFTAIRNMDPVLARNARVLGGRRRNLVRDVYAPAVGAAVVVSLRLSAAIALLATLLSEFIASSSGIGNQIRQGQNFFENDIVLAGIVLIALVTFTVDRLALLVQRRALRWRRG